MKWLIKMKILFNLIFLLTFGLFTTPVMSLSSEWSIGEKSKVRLISPYTTSNNSKKLILGLEYELDNEWKTYWKSPGGGGFPQKIIWNNSININSLQIEWPRPIEFEILGLSSIGYKDKVIFPLIIEINDKDKITEINLNVNYLVCKNICIPGNANLFLNLPGGEGEPTDFFYDIEKIKSSTSINNISLSTISNLDFSIKSNQSNILAEIDISTNKYFDNPKIFIHTPFGLPVVKPILKYSFDYKKMTASFQYDKKQFTKNKFPIEIFIYDNNINYNYNNVVEIEEVSNFLINSKSIIFILFISIIGGLILNFMPCVFPVLSIKLLSVLNTDKSEIRVSFIITALGIIASFLLLGLFFSVLKQLNISIAWGMQFQEPYFILFILTIISLFFINTIGLFEINLPRFLSSSNIFTLGNNLYTKNFFSGFFATLLATPCSAPYIGTAVTAAFTKSTLELFLIFFAMGFGMSIPYFIIIFFPRLINYLPKPGKWTIYFKYFLSLLLFITIIWLINILLGYYNYFFICFLILIFLIIALIIKNKFYQKTLTLALIISIFILPSINFFKNNESLIADNLWIDFNEIEIPSLIASNKIIFLDITADWCITCKFNKVNVINSQEIKNLFKKNDVVLVKADWTKPNNSIDLFLKKYNKFGIPFNAIYSKKYPDGIILSEILTQNEIVESFKKIIK